MHCALANGGCCVSMSYLWLEPSGVAGRDVRRFVFGAFDAPDTGSCSCIVFRLALDAWLDVAARAIEFQQDRDVQSLCKFA